MKELTEQQAKEWFCDTCYKCYNAGEEKEKCVELESFIKTGKEKGYIKRTHLEKARKEAAFWKDNKCYTFDNDGVYSNGLKIGNPHIILIQDMNRVVHGYELAIKELQIKLEERG